MNKYFSHLRPMERRLAVGVIVVVIVVLNWWFVWPHFSDWGNLRGRMESAQRKLKVYQDAVKVIPEYQAKVNSLQTSGEVIPTEDMAINFLRTIQSQSSQSGVNIISYSRASTRTNDAFFVEQVQTISVTASDDQLVDFLYKLGSGASMIRVRDLELQPDPQRQHLSANIELVASYQKNPAPAPSAPAKTASASSK
jgi:Tfp pilus assembly protein PilO